MGASGERARAEPLSALLRSVWSSLWTLSRLLLLRMRSNRERESRLGDVIEDSWGSEQSASHSPKPAQTEVDQVVTACRHVSHVSPFVPYMEISRFGDARCAFSFIFYLPRP